MRIDWILLGYMGVTWWHLGLTAQPDSLVQWGSWTTWWNLKFDQCFQTISRETWTGWLWEDSSADVWDFPDFIRFHQISRRTLAPGCRTWPCSSIKCRSWRCQNDKGAADWIFWLSKTFGSFWLFLVHLQIQSDKFMKRQLRWANWAHGHGFIGQLCGGSGVAHLRFMYLIPCHGIYTSQSWRRQGQHRAANMTRIAQAFVESGNSMVVTVVMVNRTAWSKSLCQLQASTSPYLQASGLRVLEWFKTMDKMIIWW